ncbi:ABC-three component system middle component 2 [Curtobacterium flaccumfaciens]|uniref:ABC-three component system middle component 2 n=1 Tax=Curtobacterium flaccumfaciens TaxID=2035 RepID=UPI001BDE0204|nr:ABC-three component system middle component 2 [Curtobacterium flaccumfaciens]MBT1597274.1 hypothetical protein [Curtobacterium flaccumfaciens pv. flaccumfaciens]
MTQLLNSPLEVGVRVVALLTALYPGRADIARIVLLDHVILHSGDFAGQSSLHPETPGRVGELGVKRELIRDGIILMGARGLIARDMTTAGIYYSAAEDANPFLESIDAEYLVELRARCVWAASTFGVLGDDEIRMRLSAVFGSWSEEFQWLNGQGHDG